MKSKTRLARVSTIEGIAQYILNKKVSFKYSGTFLEVTADYFTDFRYASYHSETGELILMDWEHNQFIPKPGIA